jgi:broad specificity phosphatase PhoE
MEDRAAHKVANHNFDLTPRGRKQAEITAVYLHEQYKDGFSAVFSSYYTRALETAKILTPNQKIHEDPLLAELNCGIWHSMIPSLIHQHMPWEFARQKKEGFYHYRPIGGENGPDVEQRVELFKNRLRGQREPVLVVIHGNWYRYFEKNIFGHTTEWLLKRFDEPAVENASVTVYGSNDIGRQLVLKKETVVPWRGKID